MKKLPLIIAKIDLRSTGTSQRYKVGKPGDEVSGALYLPKDLQLPCELTIAFLAGEREREARKEVRDEE